MAKLTKRLEALVDKLEKDGHELNAPLIKNFFALQHRQGGTGGITYRRTMPSFNELAEYHYQAQEKLHKLGKLSEATLEI